MRKAIILMNHIKSSAENVTEFDFGFPDRQAAIDFINQHSVEPYIDDSGENNDYGFAPKYRKCFAKGSPLEWVNPLSASEMAGNIRHNRGTIEIELQMAEQWVRVS